MSEERTNEQYKSFRVFWRASRQMRLTTEKCPRSGQLTAGIKQCDACGEQQYLKRPRRWDVCLCCERKQGYAEGRRVAPKQEKKQCYINYCVECHRVFEVKGRGLWKQPHCSSKCAGKKLIGRAPPNKKYDRKDMHPRLQTLGPKGENEHQWRLSILAKRGYKCELTGLTSRLMVCHHIVSYKADPTLQFSEDNVIVMLASLHKKFHIEYMGGWTKAYTKAQWEEFVNLVKQGVIEYE